MSMTMGPADLNRYFKQLRVESRLELRLVIRAAVHDDLAKLEWYGQYAHFRDLFRRTWLDHQAGRRLMIVADLRGFPVGQVWLDVTHTEYAYLYALRVFDPFQGSGIGTRLMNMAASLAVKHHYDEIRLAVERTNQGARRLYERQGYEIINQRVDIWSYTDQYGKVVWMEEDVYGMKKDLTPADA